MKIKSGFTLAETLITLTIIGVVAAMTIPTLMTKYQDHVLEVGQKKAYSILRQAYTMMPITEGCPAGDYDCAGNITPDEYGVLLPDFTTPLKKQLKIVKECGAKQSGCGPDKIKHKNFNFHTSSFYNWESFITADGMAWAILDDTAPPSAAIHIDTNGEKGPNIYGQDVKVYSISAFYPYELTEEW